ncbi:MAG: hypothetical protein WD250_09150 [Egibacteraceae bacterium]
MNLSTELRRPASVLQRTARIAMLAQEAARRGTSVASLIREAIDRVYAGATADRQDAAAAILEASPMPVEDWAPMKAGMLDEMAGEPG